MSDGKFKPPESIDAVSRENYLVQRMLDEGLSFDRETYIALFYPDGTPSPWTADHEALLPPVFRERHTEQIREALQNFGDAIGVTYTGEIPH